MVKSNQNYFCLFLKQKNCEFPVRKLNFLLNFSFIDSLKKSILDVKIKLKLFQEMFAAYFQMGNA